MTPAEFIQLLPDGSVEEVSARLAETPSLARSRSDEGVSAVLIALYHRRPEIADLLRDSGLELDEFEASALGETGQLTARLANDASAVNGDSTDGFTPLHLACFFGRDAAARLLLELGAAPSAVAANPSRVQPLHSAAASRNREIIALLIEHGADVDARQHGGWTALHSAAMHGDAAIARLLLEHGADPELAADDGSTPHDLAEKGGHSDVQELLRGRSN